MKYGEAFAGFPLATTLVLASPVLGHAFPVFFAFRAARELPLPSAVYWVFFRNPRRC